MNLSKTEISIIIPVYNGEKTIESCLNSLLNQTIPAEIIVIDDGSTDKTLPILKKNFHFKIKLITQHHQGPAIARNKGARLASGKILVFADADMTFAPDYLEVLTQPILEGKEIGTFTTEEYVANWDNVWARCWNIQEGWEPKKRFPPNPPKRGTDFRAILKDKFLSVGGFDDIGYTDTWTLFQKLGVRPLATQAKCYHRNPATLKQVFYQARWSAKRPYKLGFLGQFYALLRTSLPISLIVGPLKAAKHHQPEFILFKLVYDAGRFLGLLELIFLAKTAK